MELFGTEAFTQIPGQMALDTDERTTMRYVIISREGARYSLTGTPEGTVFFASQAAAWAEVPNVESLVTSGDMPLRVVPEDSSLVRC